MHEIYLLQCLKGGLARTRGLLQGALRLSHGQMVAIPLSLARDYITLIRTLKDSLYAGGSRLFTLFVSVYIFLYTNMRHPRGQAGGPAHRRGYGGERSHLARCAHSRPSRQAVVPVVGRAYRLPGRGSSRCLVARARSRAGTRFGVNVQERAENAAEVCCQQP